MWNYKTFKPLEWDGMLGAVSQSLSEKEEKESETVFQDGKKIFANIYLIGD